MSKIYTAQEMRDRADYESKVNGNPIAATMLRQAADLMEREKRWESVNETIVTWCAVTKNGFVLGEGNNNIEMLYHVTCLDRILHRGSLPLCMTRLAAKDICRAWNKNKSKHSSYWAMPKKIVFKMMEVKDGK